MYILKFLVILQLLIPMRIEAQRRIFAGKQVTSTKDMPFAVALFIDSKDSEKIGIRICAGSYIRPLWVLTASHCFEPHFPIKDHKPTYDVFMCMGAIDALEHCPKKDQRDANGVYPYPPEVTFNLHDVCLVSIAEPWVLGATIQIAKLPSGKVDKKTYHNMECMIGGWGKTVVGNESSRIFKQAVVKCFVGDDKKCHVADDKTQICAIGVTGMACHGDAGGPLFCKGVVIGVAKAVTGSGKNGPKCNSITETTVYYTMVQAYYDWITNTVGYSGGIRIVPNNLCLFIIYVSLYFFYILN